MPRVIVWRETVLPGSETFIANQVGALRRWEPVVAGLRAQDEGLDVRPGFVLDAGRTPARRADRRLFARTGVGVRVGRLLRGAALVHAHFGPDAARIARAAVVARRPLLATFHGYDATIEPAALGVDYRVLFARAAGLVAVSGFIRDRLVALGAPAERIRVLPIGVPVPPDPGEPAGPPRLLFVGRLVEKKGCADLLDALAGLEARPPLTVIGDGPLRGPLQRRAAELRVDARFLGRRSPPQIAAAMRDATAFCVPSRTAGDGDREGFGMVFLEAAAHRLPVVGYASGGVPEAVADGGTGLLAPEGDVPGLARRLARLLDDPGLARRLGAAGRERVEREFELGACTAALESYYDAVVTQAGTARLRSRATTSVSARGSAARSRPR